VNSLILPILVPLAGAALALLWPRRERLLSGLAIHLNGAVAVGLLVAVAGGELLLLRVGGWPGSFGIVLVADRLSALMLLLNAFLGLCTYYLVLGGALTGERRRLHPLLLLLLAGVNWAFITGDLFNLFVSFELVLLCTYALLLHADEAAGSGEGYRFVLLNVITGMLFLAAAGLAYGTWGTLNFAELALRVRAGEGGAAGLAVAALLLVVFGAKAAVFPLFFWMPNAYPQAPPALLPLFSGILTKVGVYALFRVFTLVFELPQSEYLRTVVAIVAGATMLVGVLGALSQWSMRHILAFHSVSQIGYMVFALALYTPLAIAAGIVYVAHHALVKSTLMAIAGATARSTGSDTLKSHPALLARQPGLAACFLVAAVSLAGLPPSSGFYGKYLLTVQGFATGAWTLAVVGLVTSLLTLASMVKIWVYCCQGSPAHDTPLTPLGGQRPVVLTMTAVVALAGLGGGWLVGYAVPAANDMLNPAERYIPAVLGDDVRLPGLASPPVVSEASP